MAQHPLPPSHEIAGMQLSALCALARSHCLSTENIAAPKLRQMLNLHISRIISSSKLDDGTPISSLSIRKQSEALSDYGFDGVEEADVTRYLAAVLNGLISSPESEGSSSTSAKKKKDKVTTRSAAKGKSKKQRDASPARAQKAASDSDSSEDEAPRPSKRKRKPPALENTSSEEEEPSSKKRRGKHDRGRPKKEKSTESPQGNAPSFAAHNFGTGFGASSFGGFGNASQQNLSFGSSGSGSSSWQSSFSSNSGFASNGWPSGAASSSSGAFNMGGSFGNMHAFGSGSPGYEIVDPKSVPQAQGTPFSDVFKGRCTILEQTRSNSVNAVMSAGISRVHKLKETRYLLSSTINEAAAFSLLGHATHLATMELSRLASGGGFEPDAMRDVCGALAQVSNTAIDCAQNRAFRQRYYVQRDQLDFKALGMADKCFAESFDIFSSASAGNLSIEKAIREGAAWAAKKARDDDPTPSTAPGSAAANTSLIPYSAGGGGRNRDRNGGARQTRRSRSRSP